MAITLDIPCVGYAVKADIYESEQPGPILLWLTGRTSYRKKQHYLDFSTKMAAEQKTTSVAFDYSGHGDSPFNMEDLCPAQHFLEVITVFDWMREQNPAREMIVIGSSYGGLMATQLTKYRTFDKLVLRSPAIYRPEDFYTRLRDEDDAATMAFRKDVEKLAAHPLLACASKFAGKTLLVVHENDEFITRETTDAYAKAFNATTIVAQGLSHSLDDATPAQVREYFEDIYAWLTAQD